jgi:hypothetical protein
MSMTLNHKIKNRTSEHGQLQCKKNRRLPSAEAQWTYGKLVHNMQIITCIAENCTFKVVTEIPFSASQIMLVASSDAVASRCVPGLKDNPFT